jgi:hypothetical protein
MVAQLQPASSSSGEAPPSVAIEGAEVGIKADKKRHKQHHSEVSTDDDGGINEQAGGTSVKHATEAVGNSKHQARPSMNHFEKLLEESCLNHAYIVKHKLRDCSLMKSFVAMGSLPRARGHGSPHRRLHGALSWRGCSHDGLQKELTTGEAPRARPNPTSPIP